MSTQNFILRAGDPYCRIKDITFSDFKLQQLQRTGRPYLATILTWFYRGVYAVFVTFEYLTIRLLERGRIELHALAYGDEKWNNQKSE